jgi:hypothetical protein
MIHIKDEENLISIDIAIFTEQMESELKIESEPCETFLCCLEDVEIQLKSIRDAVNLRLTEVNALILTLKKTTS